MKSLDSNVEPRATHGLTPKMLLSAPTFLRLIVEGRLAYAGGSTDAAHREVERIVTALGADADEWAYFGPVVSAVFRLDGFTRSGREVVVEQLGNELFAMNNDGTLRS